MRRLFLAVLLLIPTLAHAATWQQLTNTKIDNVCACTHGFPEVCGNEGCKAVLSWSGGVYDSARNRLIVFGGGHGAYYGNEVYALNLSGSPPNVVRLTNPGLPLALDTDSTANGTQPCARHDYDGLEYMPHVDRMFVFGGSRAGNGFFTNDTWTFNLATNVWQRMNPGGVNPRPDPGITTGFDTNTNKVFLHDRFDLYSYDFALNTYVKLSNNNTTIGIHFGGVVDPVRRRYYIIGPDSEQSFAPRVYFYDINPATSNYTRQMATTTGGDTLLVTTYPGVDFDPSSDRIVSWNGGDTVYFLNTVTNQWSTQTATGSPGASSPNQGRGAHGRWRRIANGTFVILNDTNQDAFLFLTGAAPPDDFTTRCAAAGVVRCFGFDTTADFPICGGGTGGCFGQNFGIMPPSGTTDYTRAVRDTTQAASGASSLHFIIPSNVGADVSGSWFANFSSNLLTQFGANQTFFIQWRQRFDNNLMNTLILDTANDPQNGIKQIILAPGDQTDGTRFTSCEASHVVVETYVQAMPRFPTVYNSCTGSASHGPFEHFYEPVLPGPSDYKLQNAVPQPGCRYQTSGATGCEYWAANEWMTFKMRLDIGPRSGDEWINSRVRMWVARQGQASRPMLDWQPGIPGYFQLTAGPAVDDQKFGKVWLLPYMTGKNPAQATPVMNTWFDELIISTQDIADPGGVTPPPVDTTPPAPPSGVIVR